MSNRFIRIKIKIANKKNRSNKFTDIALCAKNASFKTISLIIRKNALKFNLLTIYRFMSLFKLLIQRLAG
jgi:hypothetical protein